MVAHLRRPYAEARANCASLEGTWKPLLSLTALRLSNGIPVYTYIDGNHSSMHSFLLAIKQGLTCHKEKLLCRVSELQLPSPLIEFLHIHYSQMIIGYIIVPRSTGASLYGVRGIETTRVHGSGSESLGCATPDSVAFPEEFTQQDCL